MDGLHHLLNRLIYITFPEVCVQRRLSFLEIFNVMHQKDANLLASKAKQSTPKHFTMNG